MIQEEQQSSEQPMEKGVEHAGGHSVKQPVRQNAHSSQPHFQKPRAGGQNEFKARKGIAGAVVASNTVYVGKKPPLVYAFAVVAKFNQGEKEVLVKARGNAIVTAVNISQMVKHKFIPTLAIGKIELSTEELTGEDGKAHKVSSMLIPLTK